MYGADPNTTFNGESPLYAACSNKIINLNKIKILIEHGADINYEYEGKTPLYAACCEHQINLNVIEYLLSHGADINKGSETPFYAICSNQYTNHHIISYFLEHGADIFKGDQNCFSTACLNPCINYLSIKQMISIYKTNNIDILSSNEGLINKICQIENPNEITQKFILKTLIENGFESQITSRVLNLVLYGMNKYGREKYRAILILLLNHAKQEEIKECYKNPSYRDSNIYNLIKSYIKD